MKRHFPEHDAPPKPDRMSHLPLWFLSVAGAVVLTITGVHAYCASFSHFAPYDDEGFMMASVQNYLKGHPLYDQVLTPYGPFYYNYQWLIHGFGILPVAHNVTRGLCIFHWLLASSLLALAGARVTRSALVGTLVFIQAVFHLTTITREPSHPQEVVAVLLAFAVFVAAGGVHRKSTLALLGAIGAAAFFTKINVGGFLGLALMLAICCHMPWFQSRPFRFWALLALSSLAPLVLMRAHLAESWIYLAIVCTALVAAGVIAKTVPSVTSVGPVDALRACVSFAALSFLFLVGLAIAGSSPRSIMEYLVFIPYRLGSRYYTISGSPSCLWSVFASLLTSATVVALRTRRRFWEAGITVAKGLYGLVGITLLLMSRADHYPEFLNYLLPWTWLVILPTRAGNSTENPAKFPRTFLCLVAIFQSLQAYPVAGTQITIGTFLIVPIYSICLHDAVTTLIDSRWVTQEIEAIRATAARLSEGLALAILVYLAACWYKPLQTWHRYSAIPSARLRGGDHLHLPEAQADTYRQLARCLDTDSDAFLTVPGFNSLYFWTGRNPPTYFNASFIWANDDQQAGMIAELRKARRPFIVLNDSPTIMPNDGGSLYAYPEGPLPRLIREQCHEVKKIGTFRILEVVKSPGETE